MIKKLAITLLFIIGLFTSSNGQEKFIYNQTGLNPKYLVVEIDSLSKNELFKKSINWIKETYKNPDKVIKTTIDNEKVRFEGFKSNDICINNGMICYDVLYTIEVAFKDNKYKFTPISLEFGVGSMTPIDLADGNSLFYNKKGYLKKMYKTVPNSIDNLFNELNKSLEKYLTTETKNSESDDW